VFELKLDVFDHRLADCARLEVRNKPAESDDGDFAFRRGTGRRSESALVKLHRVGGESGGSSDDEEQIE
jgi:hypothetical protein